jgi:hypothetical protein
MTKVIKVIIPILISIIILLLGLFFGVNNNRILEGRIKQWENEGTRYIKRINGLVSSNCGWGVKREAMFATEKILDDSSISVLVSQLHYRGHWWQYWWDYEEVNQAEIFREDVMHILRRYGNKALKLILKDIERNGPRKTSKNVILVIGLLKTEAAAKELKKLKSDPQWKEQLKTIEQSLKLLTEAPPKVNEFSLKKEEVNGAIEELKTSLYNAPRCQDTNLRNFSVYNFLLFSNILTFIIKIHIERVSITDCLMRSLNVVFINK